MTETEEDIKYFYEEYIKSTGKKIDYENFKKNIYKKQTLQDPISNMNWKVGTGAYARHINIEKIASLLDQGFTEEYIFNSDLRMWFKEKTLREYLEIAKEFLARRNMKGATQK
jgi:hypothetical protein